MNKSSFYTSEEAMLLGFKGIGKNVLISRFACFYGIESISLGSHIRIDDFCILSGNITLGSYIHIGAYSALYGRFGIEMEDHTGLSPRCLLFSASDDFGGDFMISPMAPPEYTNVVGGKIILKKFSQIGAGSIILPSVTISEGVAVGALSVVKHGLEEWNIYGGNPLRFIRKRQKGILEYYKKFGEKDL